MTGRKTVRAAWPLLAAVAATVLSGCGIRATEVPTDFGPAPRGPPARWRAARSSSRRPGSSPRRSR
ncbi:hypothetical protein ACFQVA_13915 [Actinomadura keratinilytica]